MGLLRQYPTRVQNRHRTAETVYQPKLCEHGCLPLRTRVADTHACQEQDTDDIRAWSAICGSEHGEVEL